MCGRRFVTESRIVIDRPKGAAHPRYPDVNYPADFGCLDGTTAVDGGGIVNMITGSRADPNTR